NKSLSLRAGTHLGDMLEFDVHALHAEGRNAYDGDFGNVSKVRQQVFGVGATWTGVEGLKLRASAGRNTDASDTWQFTDGNAAPAGMFDTDRDSASLQADWRLREEHNLTVGADWLRDTVWSDTHYVDTARTGTAVFTQYQGTFGAHAVQLAVRH